MARGFGTVEGVATSDRVVTTFAGNLTVASWAMWVYRSSGGQTFPRLFDKPVSGGSSGAHTVTVYHHTSFNELVYQRDMTTARGRWNIPIFAANVWLHFGLAHDATNNSNDPEFYIDGVSQSVTEDDAPSGELITGTDAYLIGQRGDLTRCWGGRIAEFAVWNRMLDAAEWAALGKGFSPLFFPRGLQCYVPLVREVIDYFGTTPTAVGGAVHPHPRVQVLAPPLGA